MPRPDRPERTVLVGALLIVAAMLTGLAVRVWTHPPKVVWVPILVVALGVCAGVGEALWG